jgi:hypothetical protein
MKRQRLPTLMRRAVLADLRDLAEMTRPGDACVGKLRRLHQDVGAVVSRGEADRALTGGGWTVAELYAPTPNT